MSKKPEAIVEKGVVALAALMLKLAVEEFSSHGCNDMPKEIQDLIPDDQWQAMSKEYHEMNGDPENYDPEHPVVKKYDWICMAYLSKKLKNFAISL